MRVATQTLKVPPKGRDVPQNRLRRGSRGTPADVVPTSRDRSGLTPGVNDGGWGDGRARGGIDRREERFLSAEAHRLAGASWEEKASACSVRNDGGGGRSEPSRGRKKPAV